ncbi:endonuclease NucS [Halobacterium yunchengense]|uniref:endonuclease NucS n=1 Tax=Halobacterium yunchengense TaxID=3108497 RepID=UPI00300B6AF0
MDVQRLDAPDPGEFVAAAKRAFRDGAVLTVEARCEVEYEGRTSGYLDAGDRLLVAKPDGTFLVHQPTGHKPVNWMPGGGTVEARESEGDAVLLARRTNPSERVETRLLDVYGVTRFDAEDGATYEESGTEAEMHEYIEANPGELEAGLRIVEHERETKYGFVDFYAVDSDGTPVVVEVKRIQATLNHVDQLRRYVELYEETNEDVRGMLVAPSASERVHRTLRDNDLEFVELAEFGLDAKGATEAKLTDF